MDMLSYVGIEAYIIMIGARPGSFGESVPSAPSTLEQLGSAHLLQVKGLSQVMGCTDLAFEDFSGFIFNMHMQVGGATNQ